MNERGRKTLGQVNSNAGPLLRPWGTLDHMLHWLLSKCTGYSLLLLEVSSSAPITVKTLLTHLLRLLCCGLPTDHTVQTLLSVTFHRVSWACLVDGHSVLAWRTAAGVVSGFCYRPLLWDDQLGTVGRRPLSFDAAPGLAVFQGLNGFSLATCCRFHTSEQGRAFTETRNSCIFSLHADYIVLDSIHHLYRQRPLFICLCWLLDLSYTLKGWAGPFILLYT